MKSRLLYSCKLMLVHQPHCFFSEMPKFRVSSLICYWRTLHLSSWSNSFILISRLTSLLNFSKHLYLPRKMYWAFRVPLAPPYRYLVPLPVLAWAHGWVHGRAPEVVPPSRLPARRRQGRVGRDVTKHVLSRRSSKNSAPIIVGVRTAL